MKIHNCVLIGVLGLAIGASAQIPTLLNYQGYLQDASGNPATGSVSIAIALYTNASSGTALYTEDIGAVSLDKGVYSFNWGANGTSIVTVVEQIGISDGVNTVFNNIVDHPPILNSSVTVSDGTYSWNDVTGSSSPADFLGSVSSYAAGTASAIYLSGAPASGRNISISYRYHALGAQGSLALSPLYLAISIGGQDLSPRQQLISVPYAARSSYSAMAGSVDGYDLTHAASEEIKREMAHALLSQEVEAYLMTTGDRWDWPDYLAGESMSKTNGQWGTLVTNTAGSYLNFSEGAITQKLLIAGGYGNASTSEVSTSAVGWTVLKTVNVDAAVGVVSNQYRNSWSDWARASSRIHFYYLDGTDAYSETRQNTQQNTNWVSASYANPQPHKPVDNLTVELFEEGGITVYERSTYVLASAPATASFDLTSFFQGAITQSMVLMRGRRQSGDSITYALSDGTRQDSGLTLGVPNTAIQATGVPQRITFSLQPAAYTNNPSYGGTALSSYVIRVWPAQ